MNKTLYLHIGIEKTATTSIQMFCKKNRSMLLDRGILYPTLKHDEHNHAHFELVAVTIKEYEPNRKTEFAKREHGDFEEEWEYVLNQINNAQDKDVIISAEHFSSRLRKVGISKLKEYLDENLSSHKIKIILNFRAHHELLVSAYSTTLKSGSIKPFDGYFQGIKQKNYYFDYLAIANNWLKVFGKESLIVDTFDPVMREKGVITTFFNNIGHDGILINESNFRFNESLSPMTIVYGHKINVFANGPEDRRKLLNDFSNKTKHIKGKVLSFEQLAIISTLYRQDIATLQDLFGKERFRVRSLELNDYEEKYIFDNALQDLLMSICRK